jgi:hypothetical protein
MSPFAPNLQRMSRALLAGASRNRGLPVLTNASLALAIGPPSCRLHVHDFSGHARLSRVLPSPTDAAAARWPTVMAPCSHRSDQAQAVKCRPTGVNPKSALPYLSLSHVPRPYSNRATGRKLRCFPHSCTKTPRPAVSKSPGLCAYLWEPPYHLLALPLSVLPPVSATAGFPLFFHHSSPSPPPLTGSIPPRVGPGAPSCLRVTVGANEPTSPSSEPPLVGATSRCDLLLDELLHQPRPILHFVLRLIPDVALVMQDLAGGLPDFTLDRTTLNAIEHRPFPLPSLFSAPHLVGFVH